MIGWSGGITDTGSNTGEAGEGADLIGSILDRINRVGPRRYTLGRRLPGGHQTGAYELTSSDGERAVRKRWFAPRPIDVVRQCAEAVAVARAAGWPIPAWLTWGIGLDGVPYEVREFVEGEHRDRLDPSVLRTLIEVNERQADLDLPTRHEWSTWIRDVVYGGHDGILARVAGTGPDGRFLGAVIDRLRLRTEAVEIPRTDLVCAVFALENILLRERRVAAVIDVEAIGRGSRAYDLAVLHGRLSDEEREGPIGSTLRQAGEDVAGAAVFEVCLAAEYLGLLAFVIDQHPDRASPLAREAARALAPLV